MIIKIHSDVFVNSRTALRPIKFKQCNRNAWLYFRLYRNVIVSSTRTNGIKCLSLSFITTRINVHGLTRYIIYSTYLTQASTDNFNSKKGNKHFF